MTGDLLPTPHAIRRAIEEFGSLVHLADALNVSPDRLRAWGDGKEPIPPDFFQAMIELIAARRR